MDTGVTRQRQLMAFEMRCYRRILHIRWQQMIRNEEIRIRMKCQWNVLQMVIEKKLNLFGHICWMNNSRLIKQVVFGMVDGSGIRGRPNKEWLDQGMVPDRCAHSKHSGAIKNRMEAVCLTRGWHQQALSPWIDGSMDLDKGFEEKMVTWGDGSSIEDSEYWLQKKS